jgi:predicted patatin/cPLA2 family phospholipase
MAGALVSAFGRWRDHSIEEEQRNCRLAAAAMLSWREMAKDSVRLRRRLNKVSMHCNNRRTTAAMTTWKETVNEIAHVESSTRILFLHWNNRLTAAALGMWVEFVKELRTMEAKVNKTVTRWKSKSASMCLDAWNTQTQEEVRKKAVTKCMVMRMWQRVLSRSLGRWLESVQELFEARTEQSRSKDSRVQEILRVGTLMGRMLLRLRKRLRGRGIKPCSRLSSLFRARTQPQTRLSSLYIMSLTTHSPTQTKTLDTKP